MATKLAKALHFSFQEARDPIIKRLDPLEYSFPWPGQNKLIWPRADVSGLLCAGEVFIVEIDDQNDPVRSVVKYWPLLDAMESGDEIHPPIVFIQISARNNTCGLGYQLLTQFIARQFETRYSKRFRYQYIELGDKDVSRISELALSVLRGIVAKANTPEAKDIKQVEAKSWPDGFFDKIRIDDPEFQRPSKGTISAV